MTSSLLDVQTPNDLANARELVNDAIDRGFVSAAELSRRTGIAPAAISQFRHDKWKGSAGTLATNASKLCQAIDQLRRQRLAEDTTVTGFVRTRVAERIYSLAQYAMKRRMISAFFLPAGSGKSITMGQLHDEIAGSVVLTTTKHRRASRSFLQLWCAELRIPTSGRAEDLQDRVIERLAGSDRLILIDEAHKLLVATLDVIREVWDATRVPMVLAGTPTLYQTLTSRKISDSNAELMEQLFSRIGMFCSFEELEGDADDPQFLHTPEDIRKVFARQHIRLVKSGVDFLCQLANKPGAGGLRICADVVQIVVDLYPGEPVTAELLNTALITKLGPREAGFRVNLNRNEDQVRRAAAN